MARSNQPRRNRMRGLIIKAAIAVVIIAVCGFGTTFMSPEDAERLLNEGSTDPVTYANSVYDSTISYIDEHATDLPGLVTKLQQDKEGTEEAEGARDGEAAYTFPVRFTGTITNGSFGEVNVTVDGVPSGVTVSVQTGPALVGTALRDVTGETTFDMFENQIDYAQVGLSLNEPLKNGVLAEHDLASMTGQKVRITGAFAYDDPAHILVTATRIEAAS